MQKSVIIRLLESYNRYTIPDDIHHNSQQAKERIEKLKEKWKRYKNLINGLEQINWDLYLTFLDYDWHIRRMIYTTNWVERFNKSARRTLKIRGALPSVESALVLITSVAVDKGDKKYSYPIYNFKFEPKLTEITDC